MPVKRELHNNPFRPLYNEGDVFWLCMGENVGFEQDGKGGLYTRPVVVVRGFSRELFFGVPLTSRSKSGKFYYKFLLEGNYSTAILSQLRAFDTARISNDGQRIGRISRRDLAVIRKRLCGLIQGG